MSDLLHHIAPTALVPDGHYGPADATGVTAAMVETLAAATLVARRGQTGALIAAATAAGLPLADAPRVSCGAGLDAVGTGPGRWLVVAPDIDGAALLARLNGFCTGFAAVTDQSDANLVVDVSGPRVRDALAKGVALDLDPSLFTAGDAATTTVSHVGVTFWLRADGIYRFAAGRSFAPAFLRWLTASAAEYGFALSGTRRG